MAKAPHSPLNMAACIAEFLGMTLFVILGCGSAMGIAGSGSTGGSGEWRTDEEAQGATTSLIPGWVLMVSLVFGLSITLLAYTIGHYSGGHINCAVTLGLVLTGHCTALQAIGNFIAQMCGAVVGAAVLLAIYPSANDMTKTLGSNSVGPRWYWHNALIGEIMGTFVLVTVVLQTACNPKSSGNRAQACIAIGLAVFAVHTVLIPIDGCSINPTRSFGPALVALSRLDAPPASTQAPVPVSVVSADTIIGKTVPAPHVVDAGKDGPAFWTDMWIFWVGPLLGSVLAAGVYNFLLLVDPDSSEELQLCNDDEEE